MTEENTEVTAPTDAKPSFRDRLKRDKTKNSSTTETKSFKDKAKNVAAVIGVVSVAGVVAATVAKKKSAQIEVTLPDVDVATTDA